MRIGIIASGMMLINYTFCLLIASTSTCIRDTITSTSLGEYNHIIYYTMQ
uniref:Uncharacterized protein n=1 Tax=viral metagenome TaxID=1070528 RepID=A0A6C0BN74_9ZZZZ